MKNCFLNQMFPPIISSRLIYTLHVFQHVLIQKKFRHIQTITPPSKFTLCTNTLEITRRQSHELSRTSADSIQHVVAFDEGKTRIGSKFLLISLDLDTRLIKFLLTWFHSIFLWFLEDWNKKTPKVPCKFEFLKSALHNHRK